MNKEQYALNVGHILEMDSSVIFSGKENSKDIIGWSYGMSNEKDTEIFSKAEKLLSAFL